MKSKKKLITKNTIIAQIAAEYPELLGVLVEDYGFHCAGCSMAQMESLEQGAAVHGMSRKEIDKLIANLNELANASG